MIVLVHWHPISTIPLGQRVIVCDARDPKMPSVQAVAESLGDETIISAPGYPATGSKWWTHWCDLPVPPAMEAAE